MKYLRLDSFKADFKRLAETEKELFSAAVRTMNEAYAKRGDRSLPVWPASLRVKRVQGAPGVWEMTWSFSGPDGRATFEFIDLGGEPAVRWRRLGGHEILSKP